jgi:hypothetical protein
MTRTSRRQTRVSSSGRRQEASGRTTRTPAQVSPARLTMAAQQSVQALVAELALRQLLTRQQAHAQKASR